MADQLAYRMKQRPVRMAAATSTVAVSIFYLLAQMVFQLGDIDRMDRLTAAEVAPPLVDLLLERDPVIERGHRQAPCGRGAAAAVSCGTLSICQMPRSVASTACHWRRSSASCVWPRDVIR